MTGKKIPIKELVKDKDWQILRRSLVGNWKKKPQWCCSQLRKFIGPLNKSSTKNLRIVKNYVTGSGFRLGIIKHPCINKLKIQIDSEIKAREAQGYW